MIYNVGHKVLKFYKILECAWLQDVHTCVFRVTMSFFINIPDTIGYIRLGMDGLDRYVSLKYLSSVIWPLQILIFHLQLY